MWQPLSLLLTLLALALRVQALALPGAPPLPNADPFYSPPKGWEETKPGMVLRTRKVDIKSIFDVHVKEAWQLLYRTTYLSDDEPTTTVTTVLIPHGAKKDKLVLYGDYQDSNGPQCAPSYSYRAGILTDVAATGNMATVLVFLQEGYVVTVPDKQGRKNAFAAGHVEGRQTLDGIRATLSFDKLSFSNNTRVAGWGYSGGGIQTGWAASLKKTYAPELNMVGWYAGGTPSNLTDLIVLLNKSIFSGFLFSGIKGLSAVYPSAEQALEEWGTRELKERLAFAESHCMVDMLVKYPFSDLLSNEFSSKGDQTLSVEPVKTVLDQQIMGTHASETPDTPVLMMHGLNDDIAPYDSAFRTYENWCRNGAQVEFITYDSDLAAHFTTMVSTVAPSFVWIRDRLEGKPAKGGCSHSYEKSILINPDYLGRQFKDVLQTLSGFLGEKIGPGDTILKEKIRARQERGLDA